MWRYIGGAVGLLLVLGAGLAACPATHGDYPGQVCEIDRDCFKGELCNLANKRCEPLPPDMAMDLAPPFIFDLSKPDAGDMSDEDATPPEDM
jgi:hypothetical protein